MALESNGKIEIKITYTLQQWAAVTIHLFETIDPPQPILILTIKGQAILSAWYPPTILSKSSVSPPGTIGLAHRRPGVRRLPKSKSFTESCGSSCSFLSCCAKTSRPPVNCVDVGRRSSGPSWPATNTENKNPSEWYNFESRLALLVENHKNVWRFRATVKEL